MGTQRMTSNVRAIFVFVGLFLFSDSVYANQKTAIMNFEDYYVVDIPAPDKFIFDDQVKVQAGVYNDGLITLIAHDYLALIDFPKNETAFTKGLVPFAYSAFGDIFLLDTKSNLTLFYQPQFDSYSEIGVGLDAFFNRFLVDSGIREGILRETYIQSVDDVVSIKKYGDCFILQPWQMLGGTDKPANYMVGDFAIYLDLVYQSNYGVEDK